MNQTLPAATLRVAELLCLSGTPQAVQPPTALYNEGWMLRLLLDWHSRHPHMQHPLAFADGAKWYSEGLLRSQFLPRRRGDLLGESWTHADGIIGHFTIADGRGSVELNADAKQLIVVEAKMFSPLSGGTKRAALFDQAARNVACVAEVLRRAGRGAEEMDAVGFVVLAPARQIAAGVFGDLCDKRSIAAKVQERVLAYGGEKQRWHTDAFLPLLERIDVSLTSWEDSISLVHDRDPASGAILREFYDQCLAFNGRQQPISTGQQGKISPNAIEIHKKLS